MTNLNLLDVFDALAQTREGRKTLTFSLRYGTNPSDAKAGEERARNAWEWVDDPTRNHYDRH